jgi:hypothetical protein
MTAPLDGKNPNPDAKVKEVFKEKSALKILSGNSTIGFNTRLSF